MNKKALKIKSIFNYLGTIFGWAIFVILILIAAVLIYYFVNIQIYNKNGDGYEPPFTIYTIASPSMTPLIKVYDVIINIKTESPDDIKIGDIITFQSTSSITKDMTITHRVVGINYNNETNEYEYTTKGDNNISPDSAPALYSNVIGIAKIKLPQLGRIQYFVASKIGWLVVVIIPACWVITEDVIKLIKINNIKSKADAQNARVQQMVNNQNPMYNTANYNNQYNGYHMYNQYISNNQNNNQNQN